MSDANLQGGQKGLWPPDLQWKLKNVVYPYDLSVANNRME